MLFGLPLGLYVYTLYNFQNSLRYCCPVLYDAHTYIIPNSDLELYNYAMYYTVNGNIHNSSYSVSGIAASSGGSAMSSPSFHSNQYASITCPLERWTSGLFSIAKLPSFFNS